MKNKTFALSIAGFDPSAGAGILADIKTFEANQVYGLGVCSALTFQNDFQFEGVKWTSLSEIIRQIEILYRVYQIEVIKIGLVENLETLLGIINTILGFNPEAKIIFDPILKASAGFNFHDEMNVETLSDILQKIYLITPNIPELNRLIITSKNPQLKAQKLSKYCFVYLKGGHSEDEKAVDILFYEGQKAFFESTRIKNGEKHGSGCVLSSAIAANLAKGFDLEKSCEEAKKYIGKFLGSTDDLLGYHFDI